MTHHPMPDALACRGDGCHAGLVQWTEPCPCHNSYQCPSTELAEAKCPRCDGSGIEPCSYAHCFAPSVGVDHEDDGYCDEHNEIQQVEIQVSPRLSFMRAVKRIMVGPRETADEYVAGMGRRAS